MGYVFSHLSTDGLLEFAREEYDHIKWDEKTMEKGDDYIALWGWCRDGTYEVALAIQFERTDEEITEILNTIEKYNSVNSPTIKVPKSGWNVKVMNEAEGPVIQPTNIFLKNRPAMNLKGKRNLKEAEERQKFIEKLREIHTDPNNLGTIQSALSCGNGQIFIWTTQGNFYIPASAYDQRLAMFGKLTVKS